MNVVDILDTWIIFYFLIVLAFYIIQVKLFDSQDRILNFFQIPNKTFKTQKKKRTWKSLYRIISNFAITKFS